MLPPGAGTLERIVMSPIHNPRRSVASSLINRLSWGRKLAHGQGLAHPSTHLTDGRATPWERLVDAQWLGPGFIACRASPEFCSDCAHDAPRGDGNQQQEEQRPGAALVCCIGLLHWFGSPTLWRITTVPWGIIMPLIMADGRSLRIRIPSPNE